MADVEITTVTQDPSIGGSEKIPVADGTTAYHVTPDDLKTYIIDALEAISAGTVVEGDDQIYILDGTDSALKPVDIDTVLQHGIDTMWGKSAETSADDADVMVLKDGGTTEKTITLAYLAAYMLSTIEGDILDISDLADGSGAMADSDYVLLTQGSTGKQCTLADLYAYVLAELKDYVTSLSAVTVSASSDVFYCIQGGVQKKVTLAEIQTLIGGDVTGPGTSTNNGIPQWSGTGGDTLKDGLALVTEIGSPGDHSTIPSTKAVAEMAVYRTKWFDAFNTQTSETAGMDTESVEYGTNDLTHFVLLGDGSSQNESVEWNWIFPEQWNLGDIKAKVYWMPGDSDANADEWVRFQLQAGAFSNDDPLDAALGSAVNMDDQVIADDDHHITPASAAMTVGGSPASGDLVHFKLTRDYDYAGTGDAMDVDARIIGVLIQFLENVQASAW